MAASAVLVLAACGGGGSTASESVAPPAAEKAAAAKPRIVGGRPADTGEWPFAAYLEQGCGGSLIGARWVLTAAHCLPGAATIEVKVWIGGARRGTGTSYTASGREGDLWVHPGYNPTSKQNDVALIRLDRAAPDRAVSIVLGGDDDMRRPGTQATIIGWGRTVESTIAPPSDELLEAEVPILDDAACSRAYPEPRPDAFDAGTMVCAGGAGIDTCQGDSGGPILVPSGAHWFQFGVVSYGDGCARPGVPGIYSRLETLSESIVARMQSDTEAPVGAPIVQTGTVTPARDSATVLGTIRTNGLATLVYFQLGPAGGDYTQLASGYVGADAGTYSWEGNFRGLQPGTQYDYRVGVASASGGFVAGEERTFTTLP